MSSPAIWSSIPPKRLGYRTVPMEVLGLNFGRSGSTSLTEALLILGYKNVYHGFTVFDDVEGCRKLIQGMKAKWSKRGEALSLEDFDWLYGQYSATGGDIPSIPFAEELIKAYPDAKVVIVERDVDSWYSSILKEMLPMVFNPYNWILAFLDPGFMGPILEFYRTGYLGMVHAKSANGAPEVAKNMYKAYYARIREITPEHRLLDFQLKDGWGPLCKHLGRPIPDQPFPHLNERGMARMKESEYQRRSVRNILTNITSIGCVLIGCWIIFKLRRLRGQPDL